MLGAHGSRSQWSLLPFLFPLPFLNTYQPANQAADFFFEQGRDSEGPQKASLLIDLSVTQLQGSPQ
jgi:hypothetical protein